MAAAPAPRHNNMNIVLLGKTGAGKSASGNTILGENRFTCGRSMSSVTKESRVERSVIHGRCVSVIDTPGFFDTERSEKELAMEFARSVYASKPGVHAFLFVIPFGRFTKQEAETLQQMKNVFGENVLKYVIILFTYGDECENETLKTEIKKNKILQKSVGDRMRCHLFNNKDQTNRQQVKDLLQMIDSMIAENRGYYTNDMYKLAQRTTFQQFSSMLWDFFRAVVIYFQNQISSFDNGRWQSIIGIALKHLKEN